MVKLLGLLLVVVLAGCGSVETAPPEVSAAPAETRPEPTYTWGSKPPPFVLRLADRDVPLSAWTTCWSGPPAKKGPTAAYCADGAPAPVDQLPDLGSLPEVDGWFGLPGWEFTATFGQLGTDCPHRWTRELEHTGSHTFRLSPTGPAGRYQVDLFGRGKQGDVSMSFVWTTTEPGPVNEPTGSLALIAQNDDEITSYGIELGVQHLATPPRRASAVVRATAANGRSHQVTLSPEDDGVPGQGCYDAGSLNFRAEDGTRFSRLGPAPFSYEVTLTLGGKEYVGTAVWPRDESKENAPGTPLTWTPALPGYDS